MHPPYRRIVFGPCLSVPKLLFWYFTGLPSTTTIDDEPAQPPKLLIVTKVMPSDWGSLTHDILKQIYTFCQDRDLPTYARTCKNWRDPALDLFWFELQAKDFVQFFAILAPLGVSMIQTNPHVIQMVRCPRVCMNNH